MPWKRLTLTKTQVEATKVLKRIGECNRCGLCCGDNNPPEQGGGWCQWLEGRPPGPTTCTNPGYPDNLPCGNWLGWPNDPNIQLPEGCAYRWVEDGN